MGAQISSLLFSESCQDQCYNDDTLSLKERMSGYGVITDDITRHPEDVLVWRVQLFKTGQACPTNDFLEAMTMPNAEQKGSTHGGSTEKMSRTIAWLAHQLHERFHPDAILALPHEINLLFLHGQCPYGVKVDTMLSVVSSFVASALLTATNQVYEAHTRLFYLGYPTDETCQCTLWEAHNYIVHRSQQGNVRATRYLKSENYIDVYSSEQVQYSVSDIEEQLSNFPDEARWGIVLCEGALVTLHTDWWCQSQFQPLQPGIPLFDPKPDFVHMDRPENVTQSYLLDIVAMTEAGATVNLSDFESLHTGHVEQLCREWMSCRRVPRKLILQRTLVDGGLILSKTFLQFLSHPQVFKVDVRNTSFLECADAQLLQRLCQDGHLDRLLYLDEQSIVNANGRSVQLLQFF